MTTRSYRLWMFTYLKGGVRKTTSAMFIATSLAQTFPDREVLLIDADPGAKSATEWVSRLYAADTPPAFHVAQWTYHSGLLVPFIQREADRVGARFVLVDVAPQPSNIAREVAQLADLAILPTGPDPAEIGQVDETYLTLGGANPALPRHVLLTRVPQPGKGVAAAVRRVLTDPAAEHSYPVLETEIPHNRNTYANVFGQPIDDLGAYEALTDELVDLTGVRRASS